MFRWPIAIGVLSAAGLVSALVGDGPWDALSWLMLGVPVVLGVVLSLGAGQSES